MVLPVFLREDYGTRLSRAQSHSISGSTKSLLVMRTGSSALLAGSSVTSSTTSEGTRVVRFQLMLPLASMTVLPFCGLNCAPGTQSSDDPLTEADPRRHETGKRTRRPACGELSQLSSASWMHESALSSVTAMFTIRQ